MKIIQRWAEDDYIAFLIAQGMEEAGANVFSVSFRGTDKKLGALAEHAKYIVWAKIEDGSMIDAVDESIDRFMENK